MRIHYSIIMGVRASGWTAYIVKLLQPSSHFLERLTNRHNAEPSFCEINQFTIQSISVII